MTFAKLRLYDIFKLIIHLADEKLFLLLICFRYILCKLIYNFVFKFFDIDLWEVIRIFVGVMLRGMVVAVMMILGMM